MIEELLQEQARFITAIIQCDTAKSVRRLNQWFSSDRPEFEDDLEPGESGWLKLMDLWPSAKSCQKLSPTTILVDWEDGGVTVGSLGRLSEFPSVHVLAVYMVPEYAGWGDGYEYDGKDEELGFYFVNSNGSLILLDQTKRMLSNGYKMAYGPQNSLTDLKEIWMNIGEKVNKKIIEG